MTSPIEGTQGDNGPIESEYEPMRHDDPHQGEEREPIALLGHEQPDPKVTVLLEEASDLVVEAIERRVEQSYHTGGAIGGYTPVPEGGVITEQFMVHDEQRDPRRVHGGGGVADPHALMWLGTQHGYPGLLLAFTETEQAQAWAGFDPSRRLWRVKGIALGQPMVSVRVPERYQLVSEEEAKEIDNTKEDGDDDH